jgi:hypothetical protein
MPESEKATIPLEATVVVSSEQVSCDLADEAVILSLKDGTYYGLNPVAARVWELLQEPRTVSEIRDTLLEEYQVDAERCTRELLELLERFRAWGLLERRDGGPGA